jgi:hypothetical protein
MRDERSLWILYEGAFKIQEVTSMRAQSAPIAPPANPADVSADNSHSPKAASMLPLKKP